MMNHPMHVHGHTFAVRPPTSGGARKDTMIVLPMQTVLPGGLTRWQAAQPKVSTFSGTTRTTTLTDSGLSHW
jgi:FtsP/CotA-like multicopper oxidase with cupredoxin domain